MTTTQITAAAAIEILTGEGHSEADVLAGIDSLIAAGLDADQGDGERTIISGSDMGVLRDQLVHGNHVTK